MYIMSLKHKVFVLVYRVTNGNLEFLALKPNPEPDRNNDWYTVTGGVEPNEKYADAAKREACEEIGVTPTKITDMNKTMSYTDHITHKEHFEHCFAAEIGDEEIVLNEEHIDYMWLSPKDFIKTIWWDDDRRTELSELINSVNS